MLRLEQKYLQLQYNNMTKIRLKQNFEFTAFVGKQSFPILNNEFPVKKKPVFGFGSLRFFNLSNATFPKFKTLEKFSNHCDKIDAKKQFDYGYKPIKKEFHPNYKTRWNF